MVVDSGGGNWRVVGVGDEEGKVGRKKFCGRDGSEKGVIKGQLR